MGSRIAKDRYLIVESSSFNFLRLLLYPACSKVSLPSKHGSRPILGWCGSLSSAPSAPSSDYSSFARNTPPTSISSALSRNSQFIVLSKSSLLEAYTVGTVVTFYDTTIVLEALLITVGLFAGLTLFTLQSKWDFSGMGPFLFGGLWALVLAGFIMLFFPHNGYSQWSAMLTYQGCRSHLFCNWGFDILSLYHLWHLQHLQHVASWWIYCRSYQSVSALSVFTNGTVTLTLSTSSWISLGSWIPWTIQTRSENSEVLIAW